ncbi:enoyl-CoA hydratase-related protein [Desulfogranum marinum]|uniref:enoyl-CoA hydratase/isomerase family protein n=1 Tax=Desulfogranum marinum TaxID=453220 RepID=UPI0029C75E88|nr:enoyl-CoA hydratase-related protein [Desulfogranum marinum]
MNEPIVKTNTKNEICTVTINRPENLNALNSELLDALAKSIEEISTDNEIKIVIITGSGDKAFVAGADISEMTEMNPVQALHFSRKGQGLLGKIESMEKVCIAAVNGYALGGGFELALACDFIYASSNAQFGLPEVTLGIIPGFGGTQNLPRLIGPNRSRELIFSGKMLSAEQAEIWGIVNKVVEQDTLLAEAKNIATTMLKNGLTAIGFAKETIRSGLNMPKNEAILHESSIFGGLFSTFDQKEGMSAFLEKRKALFSNV